MASENIKVKVEERPFRENGADRIGTALITVGLCSLKCVFKSCIGHERGCEQDEYDNKRHAM